MLMSNNISQLDDKKLAAYLQSHATDFNNIDFSGGIKLAKFDDGQSNPTYKLETATAQYVLRKQPPGKLLKSAHAVDREFRILKALEDTDVPVAKVYHLCEDTEVIGSMFYVMEFVEGRVFWDASLPEIDNKEERKVMYEEINRVLAAIHSVDLKKHKLEDYGKPGNYFERQLSRWTKQYRLSETRTIPEMNQLIEWLEKNLPEDDGSVSIVHGDYRFDNVIFHPTEPRIIAVLDWELSTLGHPLADVSYQCMQLRLPPVFGKAKGLLGVDRDSLGIPNEEEFVAFYSKLMGLKDIPNFAFYLAFSFFRLGAIVQGVLKRAEEGNASNKQALELNELMDPLANYALDVIKEDA